MPRILVSYTPSNVERLSLWLALEISLQIMEYSGFSCHVIAIYCHILPRTSHHMVDYCSYQCRLFDNDGISGRPLDWLMHFQYQTPRWPAFECFQALKRATLHLKRLTSYFLLYKAIATFPIYTADIQLSLPTCLVMVMGSFLELWMRFF